MKFAFHDDVIKWKHILRNWPFVREIHRSPVNFPHKGQWRGALIFSLIYAWINDWVNNHEAGDLRRQHGHYDVIVMQLLPVGKGVTVSGSALFCACWTWTLEHNMCFPQQTCWPAPKCNLYVGQHFSFWFNFVPFLAIETYVKYHGTIGTLRAASYLFVLNLSPLGFRHLPCCPQLDFIVELCRTALDENPH